MDSMCRHLDQFRPTDTEEWQCSQLYLACRSLEERSEAERFELIKRMATNVKPVVAVIETPCIFEAWFMEATEG